MENGYIIFLLTIKGIENGINSKPQRRNKNQ